MCMGIAPHDIDLTTSATPDVIKELFPEHIALGEKYGTIIIKSHGLEIEVTTMRSDMSSGRHPNVSFTDCIYTDLSRRDFTMNAMALDKNLDLIDPYNGVCDIKNKTVRAVGDPLKRMDEDQLRALRVIRFAAQLNFKIDESLEDAISNTPISSVSGERIKDEFLKSLDYNPVRTVQDSMRLGIIQQIIPDFNLLETCVQNLEYHPEGDALQHTLAALQSHAGKSKIEKMAILLHDIGKVYTKDDSNPMMYPGHAAIGAEYAKEILMNLKFSKYDIDNICFSIYNHMKMHDIKKMRKSKRYALYSSEHFETLMAVHIADKYGRGEDNYDFVMDDIPIEHPLPIINGNYLMSIGFEPSAKLGHVKDSLYDLQIENCLNRTELEIIAKTMR